MTKGEALQAFFSQFLTSYAASAVPDDVTFPYLTYELSLDARFGEVTIPVNVFYYTDGEAILNEKAEEIGETIDNMYPLLCDAGAVWLKRGSPWCQSVVDFSNDKIKRRLLNVTAEFLTSH